MPQVRWQRTLTRHTVPGEKGADPVLLEEAAQAEEFAVGGGELFLQFVDGGAALGA